MSSRWRNWILGIEDGVAIECEVLRLLFFGLRTQLSSALWRRLLHLLGLRVCVCLIFALFFSILDWVVALRTSTTVRIKASGNNRTFKHALFLRSLNCVNNLPSRKRTSLGDVEDWSGITFSSATLLLLKLDGAVDKFVHFLLLLFCVHVCYCIWVLWN